MPQLSTRVNLKEYAQKIIEKATLFEAWHNDTLIGLIAIYTNPQDHTAFITNVSVVKEFTGLGISSSLLHQCIEHLRTKKFLYINLEVNSHNSTAIGLYNKYGFTFYGTKGDADIMQLKIV